MKIFTPHQLLLMRRERNAVIGHRAMGIWMLSAVLFATFLSIAFSAGSIAYLDEKMNDPFTFWLNVSRVNPTTNLREISDELLTDSFPEHFNYDGTQTTISTSQDLLSKDGEQMLFHLQYYENMESDLIFKVLSEENTVYAKGGAVTIDAESIASNSLGVIMTENALRQLGYTDADYPAFVNLNIPAEGADSLGFTVYSGRYVAAPIPLLAVVKRLPMHKDMLASRYLYLQYRAPEPFDMCKEKYARQMYFFVPDEVEDFNEVVKQCIPDTLRNEPFQIDANERMQTGFRTWRKGSVKQICILGLPDISVVNTIEDDILAKLSSRGVERVYDYDVEESTDESNESELMCDGLSIHFNKLDSIRSFEHFITKRWKEELQVEMTQVNAKENFNSVSTMANILTVALIVFSIIAIIIFIINMMQSYFQKVKRNLGTFKAFGISTKELVWVYMTIIIGIVIFAIIVALAMAWSVELLLLLAGCTKEEGVPYLILWNYRTLFAVMIILCSTVISVLAVMHQLLKHTPGDLIYDR